MANVFIHFEPIGPVGKPLVYGTTDLPPYVIPGSPEEENWRAHNRDGHKILKGQEFTEGANEAHRAALEGNLNVLTEVVEAHEDYVSARDANGWTPLHEAVRSGSLGVVRFLLARGSDINARTGSSANEGSVLFWAKEAGASMEMIELLKEHGAKYFAPGDKEERSDEGGRSEL